MKLRNKIILHTISFILILGVLMVFFIKITLIKTLTSELNERAIFLTKYLAQESADELLTEDRLGLQLKLNNIMKNNHDIIYMFVLDAERKVFVHTFKNGFPMDLLHDKHYIVDFKRGYSIRVLKTEQGNIYEIDADILKSQVGSLHIGFTLSNIENNIVETTELMVAIIGFVVIFGGIIAIFFSARLSKPLTELTKASQIIGSGNMRYRVKNVSKDEIGVLSASFNNMADDMEKAIKHRDEEISERKKTQIMLRDSEERFRSVAESANDAIIYINSQSEIIFWNKAAEKIFGYSSDEIVSKSVTLIIPERLREAHKKGIERARNKEEPKVIESTVELVGLKKDGKEFPLEMSLSTWESGNETFFTSIIRDITERKQDEENLKQLRHHQELILSTAGEGIYGLDMDGNTIFINPAAAKMIGWDVEELIGKSQHKILHHTKADGTHYPREECPIYAAFKDGAVHEINNEVFWRKDGSSFPVEYISVPMRDADGKLIGAVVSFRDITERKQAEVLIKNQVSRLSALRSIDKAIIGSLDLDVILDVFLTHVKYALKIDAASVLLYNQDAQILEYKASTGFQSNALKYSRLKMGESYAGRAALERNIINIPNLHEESTGFERSPLFSDEGFISYFAIPLIAKGAVLGVMEIFHRSQLNVELEWVEFFEAIATQGAIALENSFLFNKLQSSNVELSMAYDRTLEGWSHALDMRDKETEGHSQRVTDLTIRIAQQLKVKGEELMPMRRGALLHDIGKMGIPDSILLKPGKLTEEEWVIMKLHPVYARDLLYPIEFLRPAIDIPYYHHEKWDGTGYPEGLKGENIPLSARIFAIVDVWDALRSDRPYRPAWSTEKTIEHIRSLAGTHFDAEVAEIFLTMVMQEEEIEAGV